MSPRTGRPPIEHPKTDRVTIRLTEYQQKVLLECAEKIGTSKADVLCRGLNLMEVAKDNSEARQLFDAIVILNDAIREGKEFDTKQLECNFKWYLESIKNK